MQYLLIRWFHRACGNKSESLDGFSISVKYVFKHWSPKSSLILHSLLFSFSDNFNYSWNLSRLFGHHKRSLQELENAFSLFPVKSSGHWSGCGNDYGSSVSCFSHQRSASTWQRRYQNLAHFVLYFAHGVYFNTHGTYRGQICGSIIASEVKNNGYLQARYFNIPVNLVGSTRVFFCILPTRIYILLLHFCKHCCSQHVWSSHLCSCRNT